MVTAYMFAAYLCALCLVIISSTFGSCSGGQQPRSSYIVHMNVRSMPKVFPDHHTWYLNTLSSVLGNTILSSDKLIYSYSSSLHGFSASLTREELNMLKKSPGFVSCALDLPLQLHTTHTPEFLGLGPSSGAWPASRLGEDVIIGFVDTGIWPDSPSFHDQGIGPVPSLWRGSCESRMGFNPSSCNRKLIGARFFNKGMLANRPNGTISMSPALDAAGHGTHTSSTAAGNFVNGVSYFGYANGTAKGVAPHARIAMYKAVWTHGVYSSDVIAAIDRAIEDGVDVLSLSLGFNSGGSFLGDDPIAIATFAAMEKGIFVAASAGNDGPLRWSLMNGAPWIMTVGAGTIDREFYGTLTLGNGATIMFPSLYPGKPFPGLLDIAFMGACDDILKLKNVQGKMVVCKNNAGINAQVENALSARVTAAVFISGVSVSEFYTRSSLPAAFIGFQDGQILMEYIQRNTNAKGRLEFHKTRTGIRPAPRVEKYSSRGPFMSCPNILKPDVIAPGTQVLASWAPQTPVGEVKTGSLYSNFNLVTGTSMAAPHAAGAAALVKSIHPDWSPAAIRSALMTTAYFLDNTGMHIKDIANYNFPANPLDIGSGHIDPTRALDPGLVYDLNPEDYISFLCSMNYTSKQLMTITRSVCRCLHASELNYPSFIVFTDREGSQSSGGRFIKEYWRTVTNVGYERSSYTAKVIGLEGMIRARVEPEMLTFSRRNEKLSYKLTLEGPRLPGEEVVHGSLVWEENSGKHSARSPIVITSIVDE